MVDDLTNNEFEQFIKKGLVLIDFFADWCMPCVMMGPIVDEVADKLKGKVKIGKVNVEDNEEIARRFNVSSIPNFILFKDGKVIDQFTGAMADDELEERINQHLI